MIIKLEENTETSGILMVCISIIHEEPIMLFVSLFYIRQDSEGVKYCTTFPGVLLSPSFFVAGASS